MRREIYTDSYRTVDLAEIMRNSCVDLGRFDGSDFDKGASFIKQTLWYFVNALIVRSSLNPFMAPKIWCLKAFGARIGKGLYIKNEIRIKSPWNLVVGDNCWIGENVWIDNLDKVRIGSNVCISQGALLLTGNHDYRNPTMPYRNAPITIADGAWIGARCLVGPGVNIGEDSVLTAGSVTYRDLEANGVYQGIPAIKKTERFK